MKTMKTILAALMAIFIVSVASATRTGNLKVNMESLGGDFTSVEISSAFISHFEIEVSNTRGEKIYSMETTAPLNSLKKKYDFSKLEDGTYWHTVKIDKESTVNKFQVTNGHVEILEVRKSIEPFFKFENNKLKMSYLNPQKEEVKVSVYDTSNTLLTEANFGTDFSISRSLNFSKKRFGTYKIVLENGTDMHEYLVSVK